MSWHDVPARPEDGVQCTVTKKEVLVRLGAAVLGPFDWDADTSLKLQVGAGEHAGWLRIQQSEDILPPGESDGEARLFRIPASTVPGAIPCRNMALLAKLGDGTVEVQLPMAVPAAVPGRRVAAGPAVAVDNTRPQPSGVPAEFKDLHKEAWANGVEIQFLSDGTVTMNGDAYPVSELRARAARAIANAKRERVA